MGRASARLTQIKHDHRVTGTMHHPTSKPRIVDPFLLHNYTFAFCSAGYARRCCETTERFLLSFYVLTRYVSMPLKHIILQPWLSQASNRSQSPRPHLRRVHNSTLTANTSAEVRGQATRSTYNSAYRSTAHGQALYAKATDGYNAGATKQTCW